MSYLTASGKFPPIEVSGGKGISSGERSSAIDFINRVNFLFEEFDHSKILAIFHPQVTMYHFHGVIRGLDENKIFLENTYPYLIPGVSRHATNHIVDRDVQTGGVVVRYHEQLVRFQRPAHGNKLGKQADGQAKVENNDGLPAMWIFSPMIDRLQWTEEGWKLWERYVGASTVNNALNPENKPKS